jgi:hypothetical protein
MESLFYAIELESLKQMDMYLKQASLRYMLRSGAKYNYAGHTALTLACTKKNPLIAETLIVAGASVDQRNSLGFPPLYYACFPAAHEAFPSSPNRINEPNLELVQLLGQYGATINIPISIENEAPHVKNEIVDVFQRECDQNPDNDALIAESEKFPFRMDATLYMLTKTPTYYNPQLLGLLEELGGKLFF